MTELFFLLMPLVFVGLMIAIGTRHMPKDCLSHLATTTVIVVPVFLAILLPAVFFLLLG